MILRAYQNRLADAACAAFDSGVPVSLIVAATGCHRIGQGILMYDGSVKVVEAVLPGDMLMGTNGPRSVIALRRGRGHMVQITPAKGRPFVVNEDHILTLVRTKRRNGDTNAGDIVDVSVREYLTWNKFKKHLHKLFRCPVQSFFHQSPIDEWLPLDPYFLGVLLGDGSFSVAGRSVSVTTADKEIVDELHRQAGIAGFKIRCEAMRGNAASNYHINGLTSRWHKNPVKEELYWTNLLGCKCSNKFIPFRYKTASFQERLQLLAGLIDTDGSMSCNGFDYISKSEALANDVAFLSRSVGLASYVSPCIKASQRGTEGYYFRVSISGNCNIVPVKIARKRAAERQQKKDVLRTGFTISRLEVEDYYGFTLDGDGRYLLDDFTVTHNTGKTIVFGHVARRYLGRGRVMVIAHRKELIDQAAQKLTAICSVAPSIEKAESFSDEENMHGKSPLVVASVQSLNSGSEQVRRLHRFDANEFSLLILDEAHHSLADSWRRCIDHFRTNPDCRVLLVTATPDRADERGLREVCEHVAGTYDLADAIGDGYLVPIRQRRVRIADLKFAKIHTVGDDFNQGELEAAMLAEKPLHGVTHATIEQACGVEIGYLDTIRDSDNRVAELARRIGERGPKKTLLFTVSVAHAERLAEIIGRWLPGMAESVSGTTPKAEREQIFKRFASGKTKFLCNCAVALEGFDEPSIEMVSMARPTKSRTIYAQAIGRATRPAESIAHGLGELEDAVARRKMIAESEKTCATILDFVGNSGRHKLICTADLLGVAKPDAIVERAAEIAEDETIDMAEALAIAEGEVELGRDAQAIIEAEQAEQADGQDETRVSADAMRRLMVVATANYSVHAVSGFDQSQIEAPSNDPSKATPKQVDALVTLGVSPDTASQYGRSQASAVIKSIREKRCSTRQAWALRKRGYSEQEVSEMNFEKASAELDAASKREMVPA